MRQKVTGYEKKLHKDRLHNLYSSPILPRQSNQSRWGG